MMTATRHWQLWQLEGDIRQAIENRFGGMPAGKDWDGIISLLASAIDTGSFDLTAAARLQLLLERTQGGTGPDNCGTCDCPYPGQAHR